MKETKKLMALVLALALVFALSVSAFAADPTYTITIEKEPAGHTFGGYQIFKGTFADLKLEDIEWGDNAGTAVDLKTALNAVTFSDADVNTAIDGLTGSSTAAAFAQVIGEIASNSEDAKLLAKVLAGWVTGTAEASAYVVADEKYTISGLAAGYYIVKDENVTSPGDNDFFSNYILQVLDDVNIEAKGDYPEIAKTVSVDGGTNYADAKSAEYGDIVDFKIEATLPSNFGDYASYYLQITDTLPTNMKLDTSSIEVYVDTSKVDGTFSAFPVTLSNVKALTSSSSPISFTSSSKIIVKYQAELKATATPGTAETNTAGVEYSKDPNAPSVHGTGTADTANVTTYSAKFVKDDKNTKELLPGAEFKLYRDSDCTDEVALIKDSATVYHVKDSTGGTATSIITESLTAGIEVKGLAEGTYYLKEIKAPVGYNALTDAVEFDADSDTTAATITVTANKYVSGGVEIQNSSGTKLPATGGTGTTLFILFGTLAALTAGVFLVTNKRMRKEGF